MRRVLKAVASGQSLGDLTTLEDEAPVEEVKKAYESLRKIPDTAEDNLGYVVFLRLARVAGLILVCGC